MEGRILAVDDDDINLKLVSATLSRGGYEIITAKNGVEALRKAEETRPDLILLDVMMPEMDGYETCSRLRHKPTTARIPIMMLTALDTVEEKIKGFEAGADDYLPKPFAPDELQMRVKVLLRRSAPAHVEEEKMNGKVIAVYSLRGGVGVSTLAANLAVGFSQVWGQPGILVDLCLAGGQSALMLNLPFRHTWADLVQIPAEEIDASLVDEVLLSHPSGAYVLAASPRPEQNEHLTGPKVTHILKLLSRQYAYIVLDLPHDFTETTLAGLDIADDILVIMAPELASVRAMVCALDVFERLEYPRDIIHTVLNWTFQKHGLARRDIESAIKRPIDLVIPFAPEPLVTAINLGTPPVFSEPQSPLGAFFEDLAFMLSEETQKKQRPKSPTEGWTRVVQRIQQRQKQR